MSKDLQYMLLLALGFLLLFSLAEWIYHTFKPKVEYTRKMVHIGTGLLTLLFPILLSNHWLVLLLCASFAGLLLVSLKYRLLKSINNIDRKSYGSISYPLSVYISYLAYDWLKPNFAQLGNAYILFYLPILILAICDPIAALAGKRWPYGKYRVGADIKTAMGSAMFFSSAFLISIILFSTMSSGLFDFFKLVLASLLIAFVTTVTEAFSKKGLDNFFIPLSGILVLYFLMSTLTTSS